MLEDEDVTAGDFVRVVKQLDRPAPPDRRRRAEAGDREAARAAADALHRGVGRCAPSSGRAPCADDDPMPMLGRVRPWGEPGAAARGAVVVGPTPRPRRRSSAPAAAASRPAARAPRRRPVPHARRAGRRGAPAAGHGDVAARRPRRGARRRAGATASSPTSSCGGGAGGAGASGGHERPVPRALGRRPAGPPRRRPARRRRGRRRDGGRRAVEGVAPPAVGHPRAAPGASSDASQRVSSSAERRRGSTASASPGSTLSMRVEPDALDRRVDCGSSRGVACVSSSCRDVVGDGHRASRSGSPPRSTGGPTARRGQPRDPRPPRAQLRGALRPRPADGAPRGRGHRGRASRLRARHRLRRPRRHRGPTIAVLCEYDALPGIGHACGHNIIGTAGLGAGLVAAALADELGGRVVDARHAGRGGRRRQGAHGRARRLRRRRRGDDGPPRRRRSPAMNVIAVHRCTSSTAARPPTPPPSRTRAATRSTPPCSATSRRRAPPAHPPRRAHPRHLHRRRRQAEHRPDARRRPTGSCVAAARGAGEAQAAGRRLLRSGRGRRRLRCEHPVGRPRLRRHARQRARWSPPMPPTRPRIGRTLLDPAAARVPVVGCTDMGNVS